MTDNRAKAVLSRVIDKVSTMYPLSRALTDMGDTFGLGDTAEIPTRSAVQIEQVSTGTGASSMSVQTNVASPNLVTVDQHYGAVVGIGKMNAALDLNGTWVDQLANQVLIELDDYIDIDVYKRALLTAAWVTGSTGTTYWTNPAGAALTTDMIETTMAKMLDQKGVRKEFCVWAFRPFGMGAVRRLSAFVPISIDRQADGDLGVKAVGMLHGIPVIESQSVPDQLTVATTAVTVSSNVATATVAAGHNLVAGMMITTSGHTTNATVAVAISSTTSTTVVYPLTAADGALADGVGTITMNLTCNGLIYKPWAFVKKSKVPGIEIHARTGGYIMDELQAHAFWGSKGLAGCFMGLGSPRQSVS